MAKSPMYDTSNEEFLNSIEKLRQNLLDLSGKNNAISFKHRESSKRQIGFVDEVVDQVFTSLLNEQEFKIVGIPVPDLEPEDEKTDHFKRILNTEKKRDEKYLAGIEELGQTRNKRKIQKIENELRDRIRLTLGMREIDRSERPNVKTTAQKLGINPSQDLLITSTAKKHKDKNVQTLLYEDDLELKLEGLIEQNKLFDSETGTEPLFLAIGFLEWFESESSDKIIHSPLMLLPVRITRVKSEKAGDYSYYISMRETEVYTNVSLKERFQREFGIALPEVEYQTDDGAEYYSPTDYFAKVQHIIKDKNDWAIRNWATVSIFSFSKMAMYLELDKTKFSKICVEETPLTEIVFGSEEDNLQTPFADDYDIEASSYNGHTPNLVTLADTSQISAIIDALSSKNICIQGPPGTGKSQTITNMIAALLDAGKSVLFVAEKKAALSVVKERLHHAGLGPFCLELHSGKSKKTEVIQSLSDRLETGSKRSKYNFVDTNESINQLKAEIKSYLDFLNENYAPLEISLQELLWRLLNLKYNNQSLDKIVGSCEVPEFAALKKWEIEKVEVVLNSISLEFERSLQKFGSLQSHPWYELVDSDMLTIEGPNHIETTYQVLKLLKSVSALMHNTSEQIAKDLTLNEIKEISVEVAKFHSLRTVDLDWANNAIIEFGFSLSEKVKFIVELRSACLTSNAFLEKLFNNLDFVSIRDSDLKLLVQFVKESGFESQSIDDIEKNLTLIKIKREAVVKTATQAQKESLERLESDKLSFELKSSEEKKQIQNTANIKIQKLKIAEEQLKLFNSLVGTKTFFSIFNVKKIRDLKQIILNFPFDTWGLKDDGLLDVSTRATLIKLLNEFSDLKKEHAELKKKVNFEAGVSNFDLRKSVATLRSSGMFGFLFSDVRKARAIQKMVLVDAKAKDAIDSMARLADYIDSLDSVTSEQKKWVSSKSISSLGIDADLENLKRWATSFEMLSNWNGGSTFSAEDVSRLLGLSSNSLSNLGHKIDESVSLDIADYVEFVISTEQDLSAVADAIQNRLNGDLVRMQAELENKTNLREKKADTERQAIDSHLKQELEIIDRSISNFETIIKYSNSLNVVKSAMLVEFSTVSEHLKVIRSWQTVTKTDEYRKIISLIPDLYERYQALEFENIEIYFKLIKFLKMDHSNVFEKSKGKINEWVKSVIYSVEQAYEEMTSLELLLETTSFSKLRLLSKKIDDLVLRLARAIDNKDELNGYINYSRSVAELEHYSKFVDKLLKIGFTNEEVHLNLRTSFRLAYYTTVIKFFAKKKQKYFKSVSSMFDEFRHKFKHLDDELQHAYQVQLHNKLLRNTIPTGISRGKKSELSELGLVNHLMGMKRPNVTVRSLMSRAGRSIQSLKPVFMMSPLSVAQLIPEKSIQFDVLIMDEASQMRPEDAVGSIARAKQVIVVGDPKQMPPSDFFTRSNSNEDSVDNVEENYIDMSGESILDRAISVFKPARRLRWHYRSRHEELIAFSNRHFYQNDLIVFPASKNTSHPLGISFEQIDGVYKEGLNNIEAKAVIDHAVSLIRQHPTLSIMVVAMNKAQSELLQEFFYEVERHDPFIQEYVAKRSETLEPFQIRNLENVQGDERDIVVISTVYGKDASGAFRQNFGPINSETGDRRLNVLFTRAKYHMKIISSLDPDWITEDGAPPGRIAFKNFLKYAKTKILGAEVTSAGERPPDSEFEIFVSKRLKERMPHLKIVHQVGVSGYFIDMAVVHPDKPGCYLLGIECDGKTYHSAKSARDRDKIRQKVLEDLGWKIHRIWSTDWFHHSEGQVEKLVEKINYLLKAS